MNFLVPLYLAGALAIAIPIYLHLRRRPPKDSVEFSSLMFLEPTKHQPLKRRSQLENLPLLLLRCLALLLLAAMFARPFLPGGDAEGSEGKLRTVVLLDTSASMQRNGLWAQTTKEAEQVISRIKPDGTLAIITVDRTPQTVTSFSDWESAEIGQRKETAQNVLASLNPSWHGSDLGSGLIAAAEMIADASADDEAPRPARIVVVSDLQTGATLDAVADAAWPPTLKVELVSVEPEQSTNVSIAAAATADPDKPNVRLRNDAASEESRFTIVAGEQRIAAVVPPGESRVFQLEKLSAEVVVTGDQHDFDNRLFLAPREPAPVKLLFLGDGKPDDSNGPEYYFRRAFGISQVLEPEFVESLGDDPAIVAVARSLSAPEVSALRRSLETGRDALLIMMSPGMDQTLADLAGLTEPPSLSSSNGRFALLEQIDFEHPALREFRDPRWRDFTKVRFWHHRVFESPGDLPEKARVVARFDTGDPAWIEFPVGRGSLLVMMAGWHPRDSQLALSTKFVPLLFSIFSDRGPQVSGARQFFVGEPLPLEAGETKLTLPSGQSETISPEISYRPSEPGLYRVSDGSRNRSFAVNLRPSESELTPLGTAPLAALGVPVEGPAANPATTGDSKRNLRATEAEAKQNLWRWAVVILLTMLVAEAWLASRTGRHAAIQPQPEGAAVS